MENTRDFFAHRFDENTKAFEKKFEKIIDEMKKFASVFEILFWGCSSVGRAPQWHCGGRRFEPDHLHQKGTTDFSLVV